MIQWENCKVKRIIFFTLIMATSFIVLNNTSISIAQERQSPDEQIAELNRTIQNLDKALQREIRERQHLEQTVKRLVSQQRAGELRIVNIAGLDVPFHWCPPGEFTMGSPESEVGRKDDETQHKVVIKKGFWIAETETTQKLWTEVMGKNPSDKKGDKLPVDSVTWYDCQDFITKIQAYAPDGAKFKLPSEAHWEYACRAGSQTVYWWGDYPENGNYNANVADESSRKAHPEWSAYSLDDGYVYAAPVGRFNSNAWGLKDMIGNVWEWCEDAYNNYPTDYATDSEEAIKDGPGRVNRGGGWDGFILHECRVAFRSWDLPSFHDVRLGFRLELTDDSE